MVVMTSTRFSPDRLRALRIEARRTQADAAHQAGVDVRSIRNWETGVYPPSSEALADLANLYGVAPGQFFVVHDVDAAMPADARGSQPEKTPAPTDAAERHPVGA